MKYINGKTRVAGVFGWPVEHSFSPAMHNAAFAQLGLDFVYVPFPVQPGELSMAVDGIRGMNLAGVNVTIPHKTAVMQYLDELAPEARLIGAVNTIVNNNGVLKGYNTDAPGFVRSLKHEAGTDSEGKRFVITGAGGAARAVAVQLALSGAKEINLASPVSEEIAPIKSIITSETETDVIELGWENDAISHAAGTCDVLINATPLGMYPELGKMPPLSFEAAGKSLLVCDLIYNPRETLLLKKAREAGLRVLNGMGMLLYQGAIAFELWTGIEPPVEIMRKALEKALNR